jgi:hypothetical protein
LANATSPLAYLAEHPSNTEYSIRDESSSQMARFGRAPISQAARLNRIGHDLNADHKEGDAYLLVFGGRVQLDDAETKNIVFRD